MALHRSRLNARGGLLLDGVLCIALVLVGAFVLSSVGITLHQLVHGALRFFGI